MAIPNPDDHPSGPSTAPAPETGATSVEYALMAALITLVIFASVVAFGGAVNNLFQSFQLP